MALSSKGGEMGPGLRLEAGGVKPSAAKPPELCYIHGIEQPLSFMGSWIS